MGVVHSKDDLSRNIGRVFAAQTISQQKMERQTTTMPSQPTRDGSAALPSLPEMRTGGTGAEEPIGTPEGTDRAHAGDAEEIVTRAMRG